MRQILKCCTATLPRIRKRLNVLAEMDTYMRQYEYRFRCWACDQEPMADFARLSVRYQCQLIRRLPLPENEENFRQAFWENVEGAALGFAVDRVATPV